MSTSLNLAQSNPIHVHCLSEENEPEIQKRLKPNELGADHRPQELLGTKPDSNGQSTGALEVEDISEEDGNQGHVSQPGEGDLQLIFASKQTLNKKNDEIQ